MILFLVLVQQFVISFSSQCETFVNHGHLASSDTTYETYFEVLGSLEQCRSFCLTFPATDCQYFTYHHANAECKLYAPGLGFISPANSDITFWERVSCNDPSLVTTQNNAQTTEGITPATMEVTTRLPSSTPACTASQQNHVRCKSYKRVTPHSDGGSVLAWLKVSGNTGCPMKCLEATDCVAFYTNPTEKECILFSTTRPDVMRSVSSWEFYKL